MQDRRTDEISRLTFRNLYQVIYTGFFHKRDPVPRSVLKQSPLMSFICELAKKDRKAKSFRSESEFYQLLRSENFEIVEEDDEIFIINRVSA